MKIFRIRLVARLALAIGVPVMLWVGAAAAQQPGANGAMPQSLLFAGNTAGAIDAWQAALARAPNDAMRRAALGAVLFENGQFARAAAQLAEAAKRASGDLTLRLLAGKAFHLAGDDVHARPYLESIVREQSGMLARGLPASAMVADDMLAGRYWRNLQTTEGMARQTLDPEFAAAELSRSWVGLLSADPWAPRKAGFHDNGGLLPYIEAVFLLKKRLALGAPVVHGDSVRIYGSLLIDIISVADHRYLIAVRPWRARYPGTQPTVALQQTFLRMLIGALEQVRTGRIAAPIPGPK